MKFKKDQIRYSITPICIILIILTVLLFCSASDRKIAEVIHDTTAPITEVTTRLTIKNEQITLVSETPTQKKEKIQENAEQTTKESIERNSTIRNIQILAESCSISDEKLEFAKNILKSLPDQFFMYHVKQIKFVDEIPKYGKECHGLSDYYSNTIYLCLNNCSEELIRSVIYHEFGHYADVAYVGYTLVNRYTWSNEWKTACKGELSGLSKYYPGFENMDSEKQQEEAFALIFDAYYTGKISSASVNVKSEFPNMYAAIQMFIASQ